MGELRALEEPAQVILEFIYFVDQEWIEQTIDDEGYKPASKWGVKFDLSEVSSSELRRRIRLAHEHYTESDDYPVLAGPTEEPDKFADLMEAWRETVEKEEAETAAESKAKSDVQTKENAAFSEQMTTWVSKHGSGRLKVAVERGYKSNRTYALERAAAEFPEFWVDTAEDLEWNDRVDPSETALDLEIRVRESIEKLGLNEETDARIVWLTEAPRAVDEKLDEEGEQFEPQEAIVISSYLQRYTLAMPVDVEHRVSLEASD